MQQQARRRPLLLDRRYWPFFWTQFTGAFNDNFFKNALVILVLYTEINVFGVDYKAFTAVASAVFILPFFLFSATGGQLADRYEKGRLIRWIKTAEIGIMVMAAIGFLTGQYELLLVVLFMMGTQSAFFGPVKYGILPQISDKEQLVGANALVEMATYVAILLGTIVGGVLVNVTWGERPLGLWIVAGGIIAVAITGRFVASFVVPCPSSDPDLQIQWDPIRPTGRILKLTVSNRVLFLTILAISWFWAFGAAFLSVFPTYTKDILGADENIATAFLALFSIGIAFGSMMAERFSKHRLELGIVPIGAAGMSLFCADLYFIGAPWTPNPEQLLGLGTFFQHWSAFRICADLFLLASFGGLYIVPLYTLLQQRASDDTRARLIAGNNIINSILMVSASLALIFALPVLGETGLFLALAILNLLAAFIVFKQVPEFMIRFFIWMISTVFYRIRVEGLEHVPDEGPCVIAPNHISYVDFMLVAGAIKRPIHFVMDVAFASLPIMKWFVRSELVIPIASPKRDEVTYEQAFVSIRKKLREGWIVGIFPEGMITYDGAFNPFKRGIERIVERDPCPVIPVAINGMWGSWFSRKDGPAFKKKPRKWLSPVVITIGPPIPADEVSAERVQAEVAALYQNAPNLP